MNDIKKKNHNLALIATACVVALLVVVWIRVLLPLEIPKTANNDVDTTSARDLVDDLRQSARDGIETLTPYQVEVTKPTTDSTSIKQVESFSAEDTTSTNVKTVEQPTINQQP